MKRRLNIFLTMMSVFVLILLLTSCGDKPNDDINTSSKTSTQNSITTSSCTSTSETVIDNYYTVTFKDYDDTVLQTSSIKEGDTPSYNEPNPIRNNDDDYSYTFVGWTPSLAKVSADQIYTAIYEKQELPYSIIIDLNGGTSHQTKLQFKTDKVTKDIFPFDVKKEGYSFEGYELNNVKVFDEDGNAVNSCTYSSNMTFKALWSANTNTPYKVEYYLQNIDNNNYPSTPYDKDDLTGTTDTLTNAEIKQYDGFTSPSITQDNIDGNGNTVIKLYYTRNSYTLTLNKNIDKAGTITSFGPYKYEKEITITAENIPNYSFIGWYDGENEISTKSSYTFNMPAKNLKLEARYAINKYTVTIDNQAEGVTILGITSGDEYEYNSQISLTATGIPKGKYLVWDFNDGVISFGNSCTFTMPGNNIVIKTVLADTLENIAYTKNGNKIYFGSYPQTKVTDDILINELNTLAGTKPTSSNKYKWTDYNYYISSSITSFMYYQDIDYDNNGTYDYRGVYFTQYRPNHYSDSSSSFMSYQRQNGYLTNTIYWFSYDPIEWDILSTLDGKALIITNLLLDSQEYYPSNSLEEFEHNGETGYANNYELSNIRKFLNDIFYNTAFNDLQKTIIETTTVDNSSSSTVDNSLSSTASTSNRYACNNTNDKMFLLSYEEATTYYTSNEARMAQGSDYAKSQGLIFYSYNENSNWWLRSPFRAEAREVYLVDYTGGINHLDVDATHRGVRPACYIAL